MVQGKAPLDVPVLCEGIDREVWPVMAQQCWHVTLQATNNLASHELTDRVTAPVAQLCVSIPIDFSILIP